MKITEFLQPQGVKLGVSVADQNAAIDELIALHNAAGNLNNAAAFKEAILAREAKGSTAIGKAIAVPHGKSSAVSKAGLTAITVPAGVDYKSLDGQPSKLIFMIAAPEGGADTHLEVLSKLMTMLMDDNFTQKLIAATNVDEFMKVIDEKETEKDKEAAAKAASSASRSLNLLAVTACPTGIAHTYMAAEALEQAAKDKGYAIKVETDGSGGAKNVLTSSEIAAADVIILAVDKNVEMGRFDGKKVIKASTANAIHNAGDLLAKAESGNVPVYHHTGAVESNASVDGDETLGRKFYKHLMNGVSHMLPFVIGGGILVALSFLIDTLAGYGTTGGGNFGQMIPLSAFFKYVGGLAMSLMVPVLAGYIAYSIADRPGLAVGFTGGLLASNGNAAIASFVWGSEEALPQLGGFNKFIANFAFQGSGNTVSGFLGGIAAGFLAGAIVLWLKKITSGFPKSLEGIKPVLIYPLAGIFMIGLVMCAINPIVGALNTWISAVLNSMSAGSTVLLGLLLGAMMATDMGGPLNKAAYVFGTAALANQTEAGFMIMAAVMVGGMVPPIAIALATIIFKKKFTEGERKSGPVNFIMGLCFITEGAIPYAAADPLHVIPALMVGSGIAGALSMLFKCTLMAPHGGIFVFPVVGNVFMYLVSLLIGSVVGCLLLGVLKKNVEE